MLHEKVRQQGTETVGSVVDVCVPKDQAKGLEKDLADLIELQVFEAKLRVPSGMTGLEKLAISVLVAVYDIDLKEVLGDDVPQTDD